MSTMHRKSSSTSVMGTQPPRATTREIVPFFKFPLSAYRRQPIAMASPGFPDGEQACLNPQSSGTDTWSSETALRPHWSGFSSEQASTVQMEERLGYAGLLFWPFSIENERVPLAGAWVVKLSILALTILLVERRIGFPLAAGSACSALVLACLVFLLGRYWRARNWDT